MPRLYTVACQQGNMEANEGPARRGGDEGKECEGDGGKVVLETGLKQFLKITVFKKADPDEILWNIAQKFLSWHVLKYVDMIFFLWVAWWLSG